MTHLSLLERPSTQQNGVSAESRAEDAAPPEAAAVQHPETGGAAPPTERLDVTGDPVPRPRVTVEA
jgi:hypothetical protein